MENKKIKIEDLEKFAYECAIKNVDIEETINFITSNEILKHLINLKSKNLDYLKKILNVEREIQSEN